MKFMLIAFALLVSGCATGYHASGFGGGYNDMRLSRDSFKVSFAGNGYASADRVQSFLLRRCAELAQANGFQYFALESESDLTDSRDVQIGQEQTQVQGQVSDNYAGVRTYSAMATTTHPNHIIINRHSSSAIMRGYKEGAQPPGALEAATILSNFEDN